MPDAGDLDLQAQPNEELEAQFHRASLSIFCTCELYRHSTDYIVNFRAYASQVSLWNQANDGSKEMGNGTERADPDQTNMYKADGAICLILSLTIWET